MPVKEAPGKPPVMTNAQVRDTASYALTQKPLDFTLEDLVSHDDLAAGLSNPATRVRNLKNIWERNLTALVQHDDRENGRTGSAAWSNDDDALKIAENTRRKAALASPR